jgi:hypothetical protein
MNLLRAAGSVILALGAVGQGVRPSSEGGPVAWAPYDPVTDNALQLDDTQAVVGPIHSKRCDYWDWYWGRR